jgi:parallel beta-helix repeat protein
MICKKLLPLFVLAIVHTACRSHQSATTQPVVSGPTIYVATTGNDKWNGSAPEPNWLKTDGPVATLERARDLLRKTGGGTVYIRGGTYTRSQTFDLGEEDSAADHPVVYRAYPGEHPIFSGGAKLRGFAPVTDPKILARLDENAKPHILQVELTQNGVRDFGKLSTRGFGRPIQPAALELFFRGKAMDLARWPNKGEYARIASVPNGPTGGKFTYTGDRPNRWKDAKDIWLHGYWTWDWAESYEHVASLDVSTKTIATDPPHGVYGYKANARWYAMNLLEEIDSPGEWYLDRESGMLYFWPPEPISDGDVVVSTLTTPMVSINGAAGVTIRDLTFEDARGAGIVVMGGRGNRIAGCTLRNLGTFAVCLNGDPGLGNPTEGDDGRDNGVVSCNISSCGEGGIILGGGNRKTLAHGRNFAVNNDISDYSRWVWTYRPAIALTGVGNRIANNLIHDAPHMGILLHGNEHVIELNELHHLCQDTADVGAFYMGRDFTEWANVVRNNFFHDNGHGDVNDVYLDDCASGTTVTGNIFYKSGRGVHLGGGRNVTIDNNIFVDCIHAIHVDERWFDWKRGEPSTCDLMITRFKEMKADQLPWSAQYPELAGLLNDDPGVAKYNHITHNIVVGNWLELWNGLTEQKLGVKDNWVNAPDVKFPNKDKLDFHLPPDSPVFKQGFKPIPIEKIGLQKDEYRSSVSSR